MEKYHGIATYTYYFKLPNGWRGNSLHAHIWNSKVESSSTHVGTTWPGLAMKHVDGNIYKVEVTSDKNFYSTFDSIIFNDATSNSDSSAQQTMDISIDRTKNNNNLYTISSYSSQTQTRIFFKAPSSYSSVWAYMWYIDNSGNAVYNAPWPGVDITNNKFSADGYYVIADNKYNQIIFSDHGSDSAKTPDLYIPSSQDMTYELGPGWKKDYTFGSWSEYITPETLSPSHSHD